MSLSNDGGPALPGNGLRHFFRPSVFLQAVQYDTVKVGMKLHAA
jgi:hypothetical protein